MAKVGFSNEGRGRTIIISLVALLLVGSLCAAAHGASESGGFQIISLKHIGPEAGKEYLAEVGIGTVSHLVGSPTLLVTGGAEEVAKAKAILGLVDSQQEYAVRLIVVGATADMPALAEQVAEEVRNMAIGTFSAPPDGAGAIVDFHEDSVIVVAPRSRLERIVAVVEQLLGEQEAARPVTAEAPKVEGVRRGDVNEPNGVAVRPDQRGPRQPEPEQDESSIYRPKPPANAEDVLDMTLPEKLEIVHLMGLVGKYMNLNFMYDPTKIKGDVTLMLNTGGPRGPLKVKDLYPLLESVLKFRGFAMTRNGRFVTVVSAATAAEVMGIDPVLLESEKDAIEEAGDVIVTRVFRLEHVDPASAQNLLTGMNLGTSVTPIADVQLLFVTGYAYRMPRVERLLKMIDKPGIPKAIRFRQLKYTMATALAPKVKTLAEQLGTVSITVGQISSSAATPRVSTRKPGESTAQYTARLRAESTARQRAGTTAARPSGGAATTQPSVYLDADERTNRILMIGFADQLDTVEELIDTLDVAQTDLRTMKLYKIEHVDAEQVRRQLAELNIISGGGLSSGSSRLGGSRTSRITGTSGTRTSPATGRAPTPSPATSAPEGMMVTEEGGLVEEPQVVVIEATNSLLIKATAEQHEQIKTILGYVDAETEKGSIPYVIYPLENQQPEDLVEILEKLIQETIKDKEGKIEQVVKKTEDDIVIVPDENTFSIIVYASKKNQEWIKSLIETLDKRRPQVLIDVTLVEVTKNDKFEYDLNIIQSLPNLLDTSGLTGAITEGTSPVTSSGIIAKLSAEGARARYIDFQSKSGDFTGFYGDTHVHMLLEAMQTKDYGRVLAKPKILVNDNETGTISTTDTTYVRKETSIPVASGGTNEGTLVQTAVDFQGYDAGISLDITPHISEGQLLRLEITLTRSDFGNITGDKPPDTTSSDLDTIVTVPDGSTIILGGMIKLNQGKGGTKVPLLGDLPLVGVLFRNVSNSDLQKRLYIFVKAEIIRPAETLGAGLPDLERISQRNRLAFEAFEEKFQKYQSIPGIKDRRIDPIKVLDAE